MRTYMRMRMAGAAYARKYSTSMRLIMQRFGVSLAMMAKSGGSPPLDANTIANVVAGVVSSLQSTPSSSSSPNTQSSATRSARLKLVLFPMYMCPVVNLSVWRIQTVWETCILRIMLCHSRKVTYLPFFNNRVCESDTVALGKPRTEVNMRQLRMLGFCWTKIAEMLHISRRTLYRRLEGSDMLGYTDISERELDSVLQSYKPNDGEVMTIGD